MPENATISPDELAILKERTRKLAQDKSYLQLIMNLMTKVSAAQGLDSLVEALLGNILDVIGGTNIILYYMIDDETYYADLLGVQRRIDQVDDELVKRVLAGRESIETEHSFDESRMLTEEFSKAYTWVFPLVAGHELIGAIKLENLSLGMRDLYAELPTFFAYVATILKNEIFGSSRLKQAYDELNGLNEELELEIGEREQAEDELRQARDELELRVEQRTAELHSTNERLHHELAERERAQEALRAYSEEIFDLYNHAPCGYHSLDADGIFVRINDTELQWLGYRSDELIEKKRFSDVVTPRSLRSFQEHFPLFKEQGRVKDLEFEMVRKDGSILPVLVSATAVYDGSGTYVMSRSTLYDISDRKKAEEQEHLLSAIVQSSDDAIISKDLTGVILSWNGGAERLYGYSSREAIGRDVSMLVPPDHLNELPEIMSSIRQGKRIEHYTTERICKDGHRISVSLTISPIRDAAGNIMGASSIAHDVTSRKAAEEALRLSEERLREAQRIARFGSWELDLKVNRLSWSDEIFRIFEVDPAQFGASYEAFLDRIHPDDRSRVDSAYTYSVSNRTPYSIEHRLLFPDGRVKYVHEQCETFYDADGQPLRSVGTVQDVTELEGAEAAIRELNTSLEQRVSERTVELRESQQALMNIVEDLNLKTSELEEANAKLQDLDRLKSMFIASMSHELRTPLNSIIGFSSIIRDEWLGPVNPEQKENLDTIKRSGKHLLSLINDVIDVSKIEAGRIEARFEEFDLYDLLMEAVQYVDKDLGDKGLELEVQIGHHLLFTDRRRLLQCVINLLSNAVKFTERGGITVSSAMMDAETGEGGIGTRAQYPQVSIAISDSGIGISREDIPKLFEAFVRLDSPLKTTVPGTGLGLYLTRKLVVDVLKGDISCRSDEGTGSTFTIRIPERVVDNGTSPAA